MFDFIGYYVGNIKSRHSPCFYRGFFINLPIKIFIMDKTFHHVRCLGGAANTTPALDFVLSINEKQRQLILSHASITATILFENIQSITLDEKTTRSAGKAAAGAVIGGLLTGGIGLIVGAAIGGRKRDAASIYIETENNRVTTTMILKPKENVQEVYTAICQAIAVPEPVGFNRVSRWTK